MLHRDRSSLKEPRMILLSLAAILPLVAPPPQPFDAQAPKPPAPGGPAGHGEPKTQGSKDPFAGLDLYPPQRSKTRLLFFSLDGDIRADPVRKALAELSSKDAECHVAYGPVSSAARPNKSFVAVEAPVEKSARDVQRALKHGVPAVEELAVTCFLGEPKKLGGGTSGYSPRDWVLGMTNDLRWVESFAGFSEFFFTPGKLTADVLTDRFRKLGDPFGQGDIGKLVKDEFTWTLAGPTDGHAEGPLDPAAAKRAEKAIAKLEGVRDAKIDVAAKTLRVAVELDGLKIGGPPLAFAPPKPPEAGHGDAKSSGEVSADAPRVRFDTTPVFDALDKEKIGVTVPAKAEPEKPEGKKDGGDKQGG
jgi:hypothetical protein